MAGHWYQRKHAWAVHDTEKGTLLNRGPHFGLYGTREEAWKDKPEDARFQIIRVRVKFEEIGGTR